MILFTHFNLSTSFLNRLKRTFVQGESRSQVYLDYAEPQPKVHLYERLCKARAEAKFTWIMPSRSQFSCKRVQSRTCSGYAERSRKCQEKVHLYERIIFIKNFFNFHLELRELCFQGIGKCVLTTFGFNHKQQCTIFFFST